MALHKLLKQVIDEYRKAHKISWEIKFFPRKTFTKDEYDKFLSRIEKLEERVNEIEKELEKHPKLKKYVFTYDDFKNVSFYFLSWDNKSGREYFIHPAIGLEVSSAIDLLKKIYEELKTILKQRLIKLVKKIAKITIRDFEFYIENDWNYRLYVFATTDYEPTHGLPRGDVSYGIKLRAITFIETLNLVRKAFYDRVRIRFTDEEIREYMERYGRRPADPRRWIVDPDDRIRVTEIGEKGGMTLWRVNFAYYDYEFNVGRVVDIDEIITIARDKKYRAEKEEKLPI